MRNRTWKFTLMTALLLAANLFYINSHGLASEGESRTCCQELSLEQVAALLGVPADDFRVSSYPQPVSPEDLQKKTYTTPPCSCSFRARSDFLKSVTYAVYVFSNPVEACSSWKTMREGFATVTNLKHVEGLGDKVFQVKDKRFKRLVACSGNVLIDVMNPTDPTLQKQLLRLLLEE